MIRICQFLLIAVAFFITFRETESLSGFNVDPVPRFLQPDQEVAISAFVDDGTDVVFVIDFDERIYVMNKCTTELRHVNITYSFNETGTYYLAAIAADTSNLNSKYMTAEVVYPIDGFTVSMESTSVQTTEDINFTIALSPSAQGSMGNVTELLDCGGTEYVHDRSDMGPGSNVISACNVSIQGNYTITVTIMNGLGNITSSFYIPVWDILNVELRLNNTFVEVNVSIGFYLANPPLSGFQYEINFGNGLVLTNSSSDILYMNYKSIDLNSIKYTNPGTYNVSFNSYNQMYSKANDITVIANIRIMGLTVTWGDLVISVGTTYVVDVNITQGTSVDMTVDFNDGNPEVDRGHHNYKALHQYDSPGHYIINVNASNAISNMVDTYEIDVVYDLNELEIGINSNIIQTTENASFLISLSNSAQIPMGNLTLTISPCGRSDMNKSLSISRSEQRTFLCTFPTQGNYTVNVTIYSQLGTTKEHRQELYVWDVLEVYLTVDKSDFAVFAEPLFEILKIPPSGFQYSIDFGENTSISNNGSDILLAPYHDIILPTSYMYNEPGQYYVNFTAFNDLYSISNKVVLNAQYGLPDGYLQVSPDRTYVFPDDIAIFKIYSNSNTSEPQPTNVTCNIDYGDGFKWTNEPTEFDYTSTGLGLTMTHNYTKAGTYEVSFNCHNLVSRIIFTHSFYVVIIHPDDFNISFNKLNLLNETVSGDLLVEIQLYDLTVPPHNIRLKWNFDDGTAPEIDDPMTTFLKRHTYTKRGSYSVLLFITYDEYTRKEIIQIFMGASYISLLFPEPFGLVSVTTFYFELENRLPDIPVSIQVIWGDGIKDTYHFEPNVVISNETHIFSIYGTFTPKIIASSTRGIEFSFLSTSIFIENPASGLVWKFPTAVVVHDVYFPTIIYTDHLFPLKATCAFDYSEVEMTKKDIVFTKPTSIIYGPEYSFENLGDKPLSVNCSTLFTFQMLYGQVTVVSECFTFGRMFEPDYRNMTTPLRAYLSSIPVISERIEISEKCRQTTDGLTFRWEVEKNESFGWVQQNITTPAAKVYDLALSSDIGVGLYRLSCYLAVTGTKTESIDDFMYLELINPPLTVEIAGGTQRFVGRNDQIVLDASTYSYDPVVGYKKEDSFVFSWQCYRVLEGNLNNYVGPESIDTSYRDRPTCGITLSSAGVVTVPASSLKLNTWSLFEANVSKDNRSAIAVQAIYIVNDPPIETFLVCMWNCEVKRSRKLRMIYEVRVSCPSCSDAEAGAATFTWTFYKYNGLSYDLLDNTDPHFKSAPSDRDFDLDAGYLEPGKGYKLKITVSNVGSRSDGWASVIFTVNEEPYGGNCTVYPRQGIATVQNFLFDCLIWGDEGPRIARNRTLDVNEPLTYVIRQLKGNQSQIIYTGNEKSTTQKLEVCPKETNYSCSIEFKIRDLYNAETVMLLDVKVHNPSPELPQVSLSTQYSPSDSDEQRLTDFLENAELCMNMVSMTRDSARAAKLASTFMSAINTMKLPELTTSDVINAALVARAAGEEVDDVVNNALTFLTAPDPQLSRIRETTEVMARTILNSVELLAVAPFAEDYNSNGVLPTTAPSDNVLMMLLSTLVTCLRYPKVVKPYIQANITNGINTLSKVLVDTLANSRDINQIELAIAEIGQAESVLNRNQAAQNKVQKLEDMDGTEVFVTRELSEGEKMFSEVERQQLKKMVEKRDLTEKSKIQKYINTTLTASHAITANMFELMDRVQMEGSRRHLEQIGFGLSLEKDSVSNIVSENRSSLNGINFGLNGVSDKLLGEKDRVKFEIRVMTNNIYNKGKDASLVNAPVISAQIRKTDGSVMRISKPVIKQSDLVVVPYKLVHPKFIIGDAGRLFYHSFFYISVHHDICFAIRPLNHTQIVYDIFLRLFTPPTDIEFDYYHYLMVDPGVSGTEYCVRAGALRRTGVAFVGLQPRLNPAETSTPITTTTTTTESVTNDTAPDILETPYNFRVTTVACFLWNPEFLNWKSELCDLFRDEDNNSTSCTCPDSSDVVASVSFFVAPNKIDFSTVFSKFDIVGQGAVLGTILLIFVIFVISSIYSRYQDGQDVLQWGVSLLADNFREDCYFYLITVYTGMVRHGGTSSTIEFNISGENGDTGIRVLSDGVRKEFRSGSVMRFIIAVPHSLGHLQCFAVWHDNSGKGNWASWFLNRIEVMDLQTKEKTDFLCYKWLSLESGQMQTAMGAEHTENIKNFKTMFFEHARHHVTDDHMWLSTLLRPVKSHFSRVQRVGCCMSLLLLSMVTNAMFFQGKDNKTRKQKFDLELGPLKFNVSQLWISMVSALITVVPVFLMTLLFRKSKLKKRDTQLDGYQSHWMVPCFKRFKFYKDSVALQKVLVIKDIVDDEESVFPHVCVYIGWAIVYASSLTSSFFIMLYSMEWGKDVSDEFLITFFMSFFESLFIIDPFKIVFLAVLFALILKRIKSVRPTVYHMKYIQAMNNHLGKPTRERRHVNYENPFTESEVEEARFKAEQKTKMYKAISEFMVTVFLLVLLCSICYSNRDPHSFILRTTLSNQLISPGKPLLPMTKIHNVQQYYHWLNYTVLPAMFPQENYNNDKLTVEDRQFMSDQINFRIGAPRLRLVRQNKIPCRLPYVGDVKCIPHYSIASEDMSNYCQSWNITKPCKEEEILKITSRAWSYIPAWRLWGLPIEGCFNFYGGGGYIAELDISLTIARETIQDLVENMWIDRETRAVFLEFTVYCTNLNMFAYISLLAEFPETGSILFYPNIYTFRSLGATGTLGTYIVVCQLIFLIATVVWVIVIILRLLNERWTFFMRFWNVVELATVGLSFASIYLYFVRLRFTNEAMAKFREDDRSFVNFYHIVVWDNLFVMVVSIIVAILTIRLIKVMGYTRFTRTVYTVLKQSSKTLPDFFFYIILVLLAFAITGYLHFGSEAKEYKDLLTCLESLFSGVLGHAGFTKMDIPLENNYFGLIYFITFIIMVVFTVANIFMAILLDTMDMLAKDRSAERDLELTTFLWDSVHEIVTGKKEDGTLQTKHELRNTMHIRNKFRPSTYAKIQAPSNFLLYI